MAEAEETTREVNVDYTEAPDYKTVYANGAYGGPSPQGDIVVDFYIERNKPYDGLILTVNAEGQIVKEIPVNENADAPSKIFTREKQITVVMRPDIAHSVGKWLMEKAKEAGIEATE